MMWLGVWSRELDDPLAEVGLDDVTPAASSASLSSVSSVAIDFDFTTVRAPMRFATEAM